MPSLDTLTVVRLVNDRYQELGVARGAIGTMLAADGLLSCDAVRAGLALEHMDILRDSLEEP